MTKRTLAIDIGGTGLKMLVLNEQGEAVTERTRILTPDPATATNVLEVLGQMYEQHRPFDRVSVGFPGVVVNGIVKTAPNLGTERWAGLNLGGAIADATAAPVRVANDADVQGFGAIEGTGVELVLTLGTGVGSALFIDGRLVPNLELGHHPFRKGKTYEQQLGKAALALAGKKKWNRRLVLAIDQLDHIFNYRKLYIGGGNAKRIKVALPANVETVQNVAGLLGGIALWA